MGFQTQIQIKTMNSAVVLKWFQPQFCDASSGLFVVFSTERSACPGHRFWLLSYRDLPPTGPDRRQGRLLLCATAQNGAHRNDRRPQGRVLGPVLWRVPPGREEFGHGETQTLHHNGGARVQWTQQTNSFQYQWVVSCSSHDVMRGLWHGEQHPASTRQVSRGCGCRRWHCSSDEPQMRSYSGWHPLCFSACWLHWFHSMTTEAVKDKTSHCYYYTVSLLRDLIERCYHNTWAGSESLWLYLATSVIGPGLSRFRVYWESKLTVLIISYVGPFRK